MIDWKKGIFKGGMDMKRLIVLLLFVLALSSCGREMWLKGEVIGRETDENGNLTAIVTETESHGTVRFLFAEDTVVDQLNGEITVEDFLTNDAVYPVVSVYADANTKTFGSYEGEEIPGYTVLLIHLEGGYKTNTKVLADGTTLHIVEKKEKTGMNWRMAHCSLPNLSPQLPFCKN